MVTADAAKPLVGSSSGAAATKDETGASASNGMAGGAAAPEPNPGFLGRLIRLVTCRRRADPQVKQKQLEENYRKLIKAARDLSDKRQDELSKMAWWSPATDKNGTRIFVLAPRGTDGDVECYIDMWTLLAYMLSQLHDHVVVKDQRYAIVWCMFSDHRVGPFAALSFRAHLQEQYRKNLDAVHVVHPSWTIRIIRLVLWPIAEDEFWNQFESHERIEFMDSHTNLKKLALPRDIYDYDKFLDTQADEMTQQAAKQMQGGGRFTPGAGMMPNADDPESKKCREQMENLQKLLQEKGYGKTD